MLLRAQTILVSANYYSAMICKLTNNQPGSVCQMPVVKQAAAQLNTQAMSQVATSVRAATTPIERRLWRPFATGIISLAGFGISIYLLIVHYQPQALVCNNSGVVNCEKVLTSPQSVIFGIPVPVFGLAFFLAMGC